MAGNYSNGIGNYSQHQSVFTSRRHNFTNGNEKEEEYFKSWSGFFIPKYDIVPIFLALLVILVNTWVLVLVLRKKSLRTVTNLLLCSLASSDLLTGVFSIPLYVACNIVRDAPVCISSDQFLRFTSVSTVSHLFAVTLDQYLAILHSLRYCVL